LNLVVPENAEFIDISRSKSEAISTINSNKSKKRSKKNKKSYFHAEGKRMNKKKSITGNFEDVKDLNSPKTGRIKHLNRNRIFTTFQKGCIFLIS
jgi:hypothetical protein